MLPGPPWSSTTAAGWKALWFAVMSAAPPASPRLWSETPGVRTIEFVTTAVADTPPAPVARTPSVPELPPTAVELRTSTYDDPETGTAPKAYAPAGASSVISTIALSTKIGPREAVTPKMLAVSVVRATRSSVLLFNAPIPAWIVESLTCALPLVPANAATPTEAVPSGSATRDEESVEASSRSIPHDVVSEVARMSLTSTPPRALIPVFGFEGGPAAPIRTPRPRRSDRAEPLWVTVNAVSVAAVVGSSNTVAAGPAPMISTRSPL